MDKLEKHLAALADREGFIAKFNELCADYGSQELAYEATERLRISAIGSRKYENFESFKSSKNRSLRKAAK